MKETEIKHNEIKNIWDDIHRYILDPYRVGQFYCFNSIHYMSTIIKEEEIEGDIVECGVYAGGYPIWFAKLFPERNIWLIDSFKGNQDPKVWCEKHGLDFDKLGIYLKNRIIK